MLNYFMDCSKNTPIGQLPTIINHNNEAIEDEFNWIFDSSANRLVRSVYVPTGSVKAHFGEFTNLYAEYLTVKNIDSIKNSVKESIKDASHNLLLNRFGDTGISSSITSVYMHDTAAIYDADKTQTLQTTLTSIDTSIKNIIKNAVDTSVFSQAIVTIKAQIASTDASVVELKSDVSTINSDISTLYADTSSLTADVSMNKANINGIFTRVSNLEGSRLKSTISLSHDNLLTWANNGNLVPGQTYRINDYQTVTAAADTRSAYHQFDIIVTADTSNTLNTAARATWHDGDTYFVNSSLNMWELKYDVSNNISKYAWADASNGKGVIYYMKDEFNNECPYDFKNIQFTNFKYIDASSNVQTSSNYVYTFASANSVGCTDYSLNGHTNDVYGNIINPYIYDGKQMLNKNICLGQECYNNIFGSDCHDNTFETSCHNNRFEQSCYSNTFDNACSSNTFEHNCTNNVLGICNQLMLFGSYCSNICFATSGPTSYTLSYIRNINILGGNQYIRFYYSGTTGESQPLQNIQIMQGLSGTSSTEPRLITITKAGGDTTPLIIQSADTSVMSV